MNDRINIRKLISKMSVVTNANITKIKNEFGSLDWKDQSGQSLLHLFVDQKYDEYKCFIATKSLLIAGLNPNLEDDFKYNFIQTALYAGYSEDFILRIITEALNHGLDVNHIDEDQDTIMHTAIYSDDYTGEINGIYTLLCANGFDSTKVCGQKRNLIDAVIFQSKLTAKQIQSFAILFREQIKNSPILNNNTTDSKDPHPTSNLKPHEQTQSIESSKRTSSQYPKITPPAKIPSNIINELEKFGRILTTKKYLVPPTVGREKELKNLIITLGEKKKRPIIVGESGIGKTALVEELAYRIQHNQVPSFLQGRTIIDTNSSDIISGCEYSGTFEKNMNNLMKNCERFGVIMFIDEIHTIYGIGSTKNKDTDMADILRYYIDRTDIKVIGTTTQEEYQKYFSTKAFKRRFERIPLLEPTNDILYQIIKKTIEDYLFTEQMSFERDDIEEQIVRIILNATQKKHRVYNDPVNNPDLAISIIDKAFAVAKYYDSYIITSDHFAEAFEYCDRIYETARKNAINSLRNLNNHSFSQESNNKKVLTIDFTKYKN